MSRTIQIGVLNRDAMALQESARIPLLTTEIPVMADIADALASVVAQRTGMAVIADPGAGKSVALEVARQDFEDMEAEALRLDGTYKIRHLVRLNTIRSTSTADILRLLYIAAFGAPPVERNYRHRRTDEELREELVKRFIEEHVVALLIDDAQTLEQPVYDALRDLMAVMVERERGGLEATTKGQTARPAGLGVLLVGTPPLWGHLQRHEDYGRRFTKVQRADSFAEGELPKILRRLLPAFERGAKAMGDTKWKALQSEMFGMLAHASIAVVIDVTRTYIFRATNANPKLTAVEKIPWDEALFRLAVVEQVSLQPSHSKDAA